MTSLRAWTAVALLVFSALFWVAGTRASVVVDGTPYHYLDDDQMISMRYARNLAEGHGLVWNERGDRVEGYTNLGWTLVMAAVHAAGAPDAGAALWIRAISWTLGCTVLLLTVRLLARLGADQGPPAIAAILSLSVAFDLLFWSINGFETTLLTTLFLAGLLLALRDAARGQLGASTCLLAGLLPVVRADAVDLTVAVVLTAVALGARRRGAWVALAMLPLALHLLFRVTYYGDWLPNTYYLKVSGRTGLAVKGLGHAKAFAASYGCAFVLAGVAFWRTRRRDIRLLGILVALGFLRLLVVGPDMFGGFRFLAPYVPLVLVTAACGAHMLAERSRPAALVAATALLVTTAWPVGVSGRQSFDGLVSGNGMPGTNTVTGVLINRHTRPDTRIVVFAAGCVSYFGRRESLDLLGKTDRHVAHLPAVESGATGHNRFDINWTLKDRPDLVVTLTTDRVAVDADGIMRATGMTPARDNGAALLLNPIFVNEYRPSPVPVDFLLRKNAIFVHHRSPEWPRRLHWHEPVVDYP